MVKKSFEKEFCTSELEHQSGRTQAHGPDHGGKDETITSRFQELHYPAPSIVVVTCWRQKQTAAI